MASSRLLSRELLYTGVTRARAADAGGWRGGDPRRRQPSGLPGCGAGCGAGRELTIAELQD
ncbi:MAG: hypothetical protein M3Y17_14155 [Actinomycetota bacterium]|nr:hypothetical protein [Actinomycetota bacterium]